MFRRWLYFVDDELNRKMAASNWGCLEHISKPNWIGRWELICYFVWRVAEVWTITTLILNMMSKLVKVRSGGIMKDSYYDISGTKTSSFSSWIRHMRIYNLIKNIAYGMPAVYRSVMIIAHPWPSTNCRFLFVTTLLILKRERGEIENERERRGMGNTNRLLEREKEEQANSQ